MAHMPVEVIDIGDIPAVDLTRAIALANSLQGEFFFDRLPDQDASQFRMSSYARVFAPDLLTEMEQIRARIKGYHPFLIAFIDADMDGEEYANLFAANNSARGLGIVTLANVPDIILPADKLSSYMLYYLAHQTLGFIAPDHKNHDESRRCVFDRKIEKADLLASMRARALCDECRRALLKVTILSPAQLAALDRLYSASGALLQGVQDDVSVRRRPRIFIGSSTEGLPVANRVQSLLHHEFDVEVWNQNTVFGLGTATLEALEAAVLTYDFGVFIFTPDDELQTRGHAKPVARDNVVFELGLFVGKLTRRHSFIVQPRSGITLPSDLMGITTASYDASNPNLAAALGPSCQQVRDAVATALSTIRPTAAPPVG